MQQKIKISTDFITLGQLMKLTDGFESGGFIKDYLKNKYVLHNGEQENRRGKKLYSGDVIEIEDVGAFIVDK